MPAKNSKKINPTKVMTSVSSVVSFMKSQVANDLIEAKNKGKIEIDAETLRKICFYVEASLDNSFSRSSNQIESSLN